MKSPDSEQQSAPILYFDHLPAWRAELPHARTIAGPRQPTFLHQTSENPRQSARPRPSRGILGVILLLGSCGVAACWNAQPAPSGATEHLGFDLRVTVPTPKVNITSAEAPKPPVPPVPDKPRAERPPEPVLLSLPVVADVPVPQPGPVARAIPFEEPNVLAPVVLQEAGSLVCSCFRDLHRGETPMLHTWNFVKLSSLVAAAVALNPLPAAAQTITAQDLKDLRESIRKLDENNGSIVKALDGINGDLTRIKLDLGSLGEASKSTTINVAAMQEALRTLDDKLRNLTVEVDKLKGKSDTRLYPPEKAVIDDIKSRLDKIDVALARLADGRISNAPPVANVGRILLANMYPESLLFVINGQNYRVAPYSTLPLDNQPAGVFSYEVISGVYGLVRTNSPTLEPGKTYTITVR